MQPEASPLPKAKLYRLRATSPSALFASRSCWFILGVNWLLQGMRGMDMKELSFRLGLLSIVTLGLAWLLVQATALPPLAALLMALTIAHTLNFLVNGQLWVCLRYCPFYHQDQDRLAGRLAHLLDALTERHWLEEAVLIGSTARLSARPGPRSDIDLRLIFPPGFAGWLRTNLLLLALRARALVTRLPLDVYAYAHPATLRRFDQTEPLGLVLDRRARLCRGFANRQLVRVRQ